MQQPTQKPLLVSGSSLLLWLSCFGLLLSLVYLSTCSHAHTDDYYLGYHLQNKGWWGYQKHIYWHWGGRYFTNLMGAFFASNNFLYHFYFAHTLVLVGLGWASVYYLLVTINRYWWLGVQKPKQLWLISVVLLLGSITAIPEVSTAYFWFSSAITYQFSLLLLVCLLANLIRLVHATSAKWQYTHVTTLLLIVAITGSNEIAALAAGMLLLIFWIIHMRTLRIQNTFVALVAVLYIFCLLCLCMAPGNQERLTIINGNHLIGAIGIAFVRMAYTYWCILQSPFTWVLMIAAFVLAMRWKNRIVVAHRGKSVAANIIILVSILSVVLFIIMLPILYFSNGSWPERATNMLATIAFVAFVMTAFYAGLQCNNAAMIGCAVSANVVRTLKILVVVAMLCNGFTKELFKSVVAAKMFHAIMQQREQVLRLHVGKNTCYIPNYDSAFRYWYPKVYPNPQRATVAQFIAQKPSLLYVFDDLADAASIATLQQYFLIKNIQIVR